MQMSGGHLLPPVQTLVATLIFAPRQKCKSIPVTIPMIRLRVRSGMENARAKGQQIGRPQVSKEDIPATFLRHYPAHKSKQLNVSELARVCDISRTTAYKYKALLEA